MIAILLNGQRKDLSEGSTVASLLDELGLDRQRVAVERNGDIVRREDYASTPLGEGDRLEVVHFVGGG
jgi:thiamine biosynthesis protein ThiS